MAKRKSANAAILLAHNKGKGVPASQQSAPAPRVSKEACAGSFAEAVESERPPAAIKLAEARRSIRDASKKIVELSQKRPIQGYVSVNQDKFSVPWRWGLTREQAYLHFANTAAIFGTFMWAFGDLIPKVLWVPNTACKIAL